MISALKTLFSLGGLVLEDWMVQVAVISLLILTVLRFGKYVPKLGLVLLFLVVVSAFVSIFF